MTETRQPTIEDIKSRRDRIKAELDNDTDLTPRELNLARVYFADCQILTEMVERLEGELGKFKVCDECDKGTQSITRRVNERRHIYV